MPISKRDVLELRRRLTKKLCSFEQMSGCYVNGEKQILLKFQNSFTDLTEDEMFKYLDIAKKSLSGTLGNNLLELYFNNDDKATEKQKFLWLLKDSKLKNADLLDRFYEQVIQNCDIAGNYLILLFHDIYDVPSRTKDRKKLDESEEVYECFICAICPVELSKAGLEYNESEQKISVCNRDWIVQLPEIAFLYPAFADASSDSNCIMYYMKNAKESHPNFIENAINCTLIRTATEQKATFEQVIKQSFGSESEKGEEIFMQVQRSLNGFVQIQEESASEEKLTDEIISDILADVEMSDSVRNEIQTAYKKEFSEQPPTAKQILDTKIANIADQKAQTKALQNQVISLQDQLAKQSETQSINHEKTDELQNILDILSSALPQIDETKLKTKQIEGKNFLLIPLENN